MGPTWSQMAERAFDLRRAWRAALSERPAPGGSMPVSPVDVLVLSLLLDLVDVDCVVCPAADLRAALNDALGRLSGAPPRRCTAEPDGVPHLLLVPLDRLGDVAHAGDRAAASLVYGLAGVFAVPTPDGAAPPTRLRLIASVSPALWQSGLALGIADETAAAALVEKLALTMRGEWIDPLALFEKVQQLAARLRALGHGDDAPEPAEDDRIARLEFEIASLRRSALLRQHALLSEANERASANR